MIRIQLEKKLQDTEGEMPLSIDLEIVQGSFISLFGPSGSGKTSILRMIAGLMKPDKGRIVFGDHIWFDHVGKQDLSAQKRSIGFLFQDYALFPNMTVRQNLQYALRKGESNDLVDELIHMTDLGELTDRMPATLSGGQQQRVALARALVQRPDILLLDEPLSALDMRTRRKLQTLILDLHKQLNLTIILVSHDVAEVIRLSEKVYLLHRGRVEESGAPIELFAKPASGSKFQVVGSLIDIYRQDFVCILTILIGKQVVRLVVTDDEAANLRIGDTVQVVSKAFNPIVTRVDPH